MDRRRRIAAVTALVAPLVAWASPAAAQQYPPAVPPGVGVLDTSVTTGTPTATNGPASLPFTGDDTGVLVLLGGAVLFAGAGLVVAGRRRRA